jgi:SAM-dependent methyltransferase
MKKVYEELYKNTDYGKAEKRNCPTVYLYYDYINWTRGNIIELGCGNGDGVRFIRENIGNDRIVDGIDQVDLKNDMQVGDITKPLDLKKYDTSICIDVFEHIDDEGVKGVLENMKQTCRQVITIHNRPASFKGLNGEQLHINIKPFEEWHKIIAEHLRVCVHYNITDYLMVFYCEN